MKKREEVNKLTDAEVLEKAIEKAVKNGWDMFGYLKQGSIRSRQFTRYYFTDQNYTHGAGGKRQAQLSIESTNSSSVFFLHISIPEVIFNHDFAKAFFGDARVEGTEEFRGEALCYGGHDYHSTDLLRWQFNLQIMILQENPVQYLAQFLEEQP